MVSCDFNQVLDRDRKRKRDRDRDRKREKERDRDRERQREREREVASIRPCYIINCSNGVGYLDMPYNGSIKPVCTFPLHNAFHMNWSRISRSSQY